MKWSKKRIIGIILIFSTLTALAFWELWGRSNLGYQKVPVLKKDTERYTKITADMLTFKPIEHPNKGTLTGADVEGLEGLAAGQYIPAGEPLYANYFTEAEFMTGEATDSFILALPEQWLAAYPQTLRRGDRVFFYCGGEAVTDAIAVHVKDSNNQEIYSAGNERLQDSGRVQSIEVAVNATQASQLEKLAAKGNRFLLLYQ